MTPSPPQAPAAGVSSGLCLHGDVAVPLKLLLPFPAPPQSTSPPTVLLAQYAAVAVQAVVCVYVCSTADSEGREGLGLTTVVDPVDSQLRLETRLS